MINSKKVQPIYSESGDLMAVLISAEKWLKHQNQLEKILFEEPAQPPASPEPMSDWNRFLSYWDFNYPIEKSTRCRNCGTSTEDWTIDAPRKFTLRNANLGGLVVFRCRTCNYLVRKKHFKDHTYYESSPSSCRV